MTAAGLAFDLACGAGGATRGLTLAGYRTIGWDYWPAAVRTHRLAGHPAHLVDLARVGPRYWERVTARYGRPRLVWASPPCQPYSATGDQLGAADGRDGFPWTIAAIAALLPQVVIIENVEGLTHRKHRHVITSTVHSLIRLGYSDVRHRVLDCSDYGVPQRRQRLIIGAVRDGVWRWPQTTHRDRPVPMSAVIDTGWDVWQLVSHTNKGGVPGNPDRRRHDEPALTVTNGSSHGWRFCPGAAASTGRDATAAIRVTQAHLAALQGFPSCWPFTGTSHDVDLQIGNAVPPVLAQRLAEANTPTLEAAA